jgi:MFS family permease
VTSTSPGTRATPESAAVGSLRPIVVLVTGVGIRWFGFSFYFYFLLLFFHSALHLSYFVAGLYIAAVVLATLPLGQIGGGISDRIGRRRMIVLSLAGEAFGLGVLAWGFSISSLAVILGGSLDLLLDAPTSPMPWMPPSGRKPSPGSESPSTWGPLVDSPWAAFS